MYNRSEKVRTYPNGAYSNDELKLEPTPGIIQHSPMHGGRAYLMSRVKGSEEAVVTIVGKWFSK